MAKVIKFKVIASSEYSEVAFGTFGSMAEAMNRVALVEGICELMTNIEHAEVPHYQVYVEDGETRYFSDGSKGRI